MPVLDSDAVNLVFKQPRPDGGFDGEPRVALRRLGKQRPCVILAFPPKAAGTYFRTAIIAAVGGQLVRVVHAQGGRDATPYLPTFVAYFSGGGLWAFGMIWLGSVLVDRLTLIIVGWRELARRGHTHGLLRIGRISTAGHRGLLKFAIAGNLQSSINASVNCSCGVTKCLAGKISIC